MKSSDNLFFAQVYLFSLKRQKQQPFLLGVNAKSQLPSTISHIIKRTLASRKEITTKNVQFTKQMNAINELYSKVNTQIQNVGIEQLKMVKANDINTCQVDTLREQYKLLLKQIQYELMIFHFILFFYIISLIDYTGVN